MLLLAKSLIPKTAYTAPSYVSTAPATKLIELIAQPLTPVLTGLAATAAGVISIRLQTVS